MITKSSLRNLSIITAALLSLGTAQAANNFSKPVYDAAKDEVKGIYKAERDTCSAKVANVKDVCVEMAKGRENVALAQLEFNYTGKQKEEMALWKAKVGARYDVAKEKCDSLTGNDKDVCVSEAKSARDKSEANMKLAKTTNAAIEDADEAHLKADYKVASEKCNALSSDKKNVCIASAKAHYRQSW